MSDAKKADPKPKWEEGMGGMTIQLLDRRPFNGVDPSKTKVVNGGSYIVDVQGMPFHGPENKREYLDIPGMVSSIYQKGGIVEPVVLIVNLEEGETITLDKLAEKVGETARGNRRLAGCAFIAETDPEWYEAHLRGRVPATVIVNPTPTQLEAWRHDHGDQRALREEEVLAQGVTARKNSMSEPEVIELLWNNIVATRGSKQKGDCAKFDLEYTNQIKEINAKLLAGELSKAESLVAKKQARDAMWRKRKSFARRFGQTVTRLTKMPAKIQEHFMIQNYPEAQIERGVEITIKLTGDDLVALEKVHSESKGSATKILAAYEEILLSKAPVDPDGGEGGEGEGGESLIIKPMSRKALLESATMMTSEYVRTILRGAAGEKEDREQFAEIDGILSQLEAVRDEHPEIWAALLGAVETIKIG